MRVPHGQINRKIQRQTEGEKPGVCFGLMASGMFLPGYEVSVVSVGGADSVVFEEAVSVGTAAGSGAGAAVTVTEAVGWGGRRGSIAWGRRGKGARPGKLKEGSEAREGTDGERRENKREGERIAARFYMYNVHIKHQ